MFWKINLGDVSVIDPLKMRHPKPIPKRAGRYGYFGIVMIFLFDSFFVIVPDVFMVLPLQVLALAQIISRKSPFFVVVW